MYQESITWKNACGDEFTDAEIEAVCKYINRNRDLVEHFIYTIYEDIAIDCTNWLRGGNHNFKCDNLGFEDSQFDGYMLNLDYTGNNLKSFDDNGVYIEPFFEFETSSSVGRGWVYGVDEGDLQSAIYYNIETDDDYAENCNFADLEYMHTNGEIGDDVWRDITNWNATMINALEAEYAPFIKDVRKLVDIYEKELELDNREFFDNVLYSLSVAFAFDEDGNVLNYEINSDK